MSPIKIVSIAILCFCSVHSFAQLQTDSAALHHQDSLLLKQDSVTIPLQLPQAASCESTSMKMDAGFCRVKFNDNTNCLYHLRPVFDGTVAGIGVLGTIAGFYLLGQKNPSDSNTIANLNPETDIKLAINRKAIHNYDPNLKHISDYFLYGGVVYGFVLLFDRDVRHDAAKIGLLYLETMSITGASYSLTAASINKLRPYAYNTDSSMVNDVLTPEVPINIKEKASTRNSFYAGHPSVPAASTFFVASVYATYHPHSPLRFVLYGVAVAATGTTAWLRYKGGYHFPTDLAIGVTLGTTYGLLIPYLHRCKDGSGFSIAPLTGESQGFDVRYTF